jgi:RNA polymerase sigma factor (sigma-70 family)
MAVNETDEYWALNWGRFKEGDKGAFATIYNHHVDELFHYATKICADEYLVKDAIQEIFLELYLKRENIKIKFEFLRFYLVLAIKRNLIKKLQSNRKIFQFGADRAVEFEVEYSIEAQLIEEEGKLTITRRLLEAMNQLPAKQKEAIYLRFNQSLEYEEVAEILQISVESVRKQVYRAVKTLREILGNESSVILISVFQKKV